MKGLVLVLLLAAATAVVALACSCASAPRYESICLYASAPGDESASPGASAPMYESTCVIRVGRSEVAELFRGGGPEPVRPGTVEFVAAEMLRHYRVMQALADTPLMKELEQRAANDVALAGRLKDELYFKIVENTKIEPMGEMLIKISYRAETRNEAFTVLHRLVTNFLENALAQERDDAKRARDMASAELVRYKRELEGLENKLVAFDEDQPGAAAGGDKRAELADAVKSLEALDSEIAQKRRALNRCIAKIGRLPKAHLYEELLTVTEAELKKVLAELDSKPPDDDPRVRELRQEIATLKPLLDRAKKADPKEAAVPVPAERRRQLEDEKADLEAELDYSMETRRNLQLRKTRLEEEVHALPALERERRRLLRDQSEGEERYQAARKDFVRVDREFALRLESLVRFSYLDPPRMPRAPVPARPSRLW